MFKEEAQKLLEKIFIFIGLKFQTIRKFLYFTEERGRLLGSSVPNSNIIRHADLINAILYKLCIMYYKTC
jgi:hypothetical protein